MANQKLESQSVGYYRYYPHLKLGEGNFATVYIARHKVVKCDVALKIIKIDDVKEDYVLRNLDREEKILRTLHHPNIIRLYEVVADGNLHCLSLELVRGVNLHQYMMSHYRISEKLARYFFYQMISAVDYMHKLNVLHRDLKLENILVEYGHIIKIVDFGLSNIYYPSFALRTHCGSVEYAAPELFKSSAYGTAADIWSLGVILYVMVVGKMPFTFCQNKKENSHNAHTRLIYIERISKGLIQDNWELMEELSPDCWDLLSSLLEPDQFRRIRVEDVFTHHWITKDKYMMKRLPQKRKDLQRKFHPEVIEYLADKLNASKYRIETHLNVYHNDKVAAMYFMVRDVLVKEVLHPLKAFENSFLYQFECWRENLIPQCPREKCAHKQKLSSVKDKKQNFPEIQSSVSFKDVSVDDSNYKQSSIIFHTNRVDNCILQPVSELNNYHKTTDISTNSVSIMCQVIPEESKKVKEQERNVPYRSYQKSRPKNVRSSKYSSREISNSKKCADDIEETLSNSTRDIVKHNNSRQFKESDSEKQISNRYYREFSSRVLAAEKNKMKYTTYTKTKTLENKTDNNIKNLNHKNNYSKTNSSLNEIQATKNANSTTFAILKRTDIATDKRGLISKTTINNIVGMQTPKPLSTNNFKKINETSENCNSQTPSRIPVKIIQYGPPAPFSQPSVQSRKKTTRPSVASVIEHFRGDAVKDEK